MSGRYRMTTALVVALAIGMAIGHFNLPWWVGMLIGSVGGAFTDNLARWVGAVKP